MSARRQIALVRGWHNRHLVLGLSDLTDQALLPILELVSSLSGARPLSLFSPGDGLRPLVRQGITPNSIRLARASLAGLVATRMCHRELTKLASTPRAPAQLESNTAVLFLNGNLWFGVKAGGSVGHVAGVVNGLAERGLNVRLGWSRAMHGGKFTGRQPETLTAEEWENAILPAL